MALNSLPIHLHQCLSTVQVSFAEHSVTRDQEVDEKDSLARITIRSIAIRRKQTGKGLDGRRMFSESSDGRFISPHGGRCPNRFHQFIECPGDVGFGNQLFLAFSTCLLRLRQTIGKRLDVYVFCSGGTSNPIKSSLYL